VFVSAMPFMPSLLFVGKVSSLPLRGVLLAISRLRWKGLLRINTLAYFTQVGIVEVKSFIILAQALDAANFEWNSHFRGLCYKAFLWPKLNSHSSKLECLWLSVKAKNLPL
jgi:hypothetical protein